MRRGTAPSTRGGMEIRVGQYKYGDTHSSPRGATGMEIGVGAYGRIQGVLDAAVLEAHVPEQLEHLAS
eukprot:859892-Rhodomonas_salina.1